MKSDRFSTYTNTEVNDTFSELINAVPEAMDTLLEIAQALGDEEN
jgi:hypothetical protein